MIRLRVVGVFYDKEFDAAGINNIKDLLDIAVVDASMVSDKSRNMISKFSYTSTIKNKLNKNGKSEACSSLLGFTHYLVDNIEPSLGAKTRLAGYYKLFESTSVERDSVTVHAWQYYVIRDEKVVSNYWKGVDLDGTEKLPDVSPSQPKPFEGSAPGFTPFDKTMVVDGDEVVWRNVAIVRNPQTEPIY